MLNRTFAPFRAVNWSWAHLSVLLVGAMWIWPFLYFRHEIPLTTFDQEWWSAALGIAAMTLLLSGAFWQQPRVPRIAQVPALMVIVVLIQVAVGKVVYFEQGLLYILYFLFAMLLMMLGARLRACFGIEKLALMLAVFLVLGAELEAATGVLQHYSWRTPLDAYIVMKVRSDVYGNMAQPNHFSHYLTLGLISLGLLYQQRKVHPLAVFVLATPLLFVIALSGSRSPWVYFTAMSLIAWGWTRRDSDMRALLHYSLAIFAGFIAMIYIVQLPIFAGADNMDIMRRMFHDHGSWHVRIYLWKEAASIFLTAPWLGVGFGQYAIEHMRWVHELRAFDINGLYNHSHQIVMQFAAETGLVGLLILLGGLFLWFKGILHSRCTAAHWWGYSILSVMAVHSSLEYPLWYAYFVAVAGIVLGIMDETHYDLELRLLGRVSVATILLLGAGSLWQIEQDYRQLKTSLSIPNKTPEARQKIVQGLLKIHPGSIMYPNAQFYLTTFQEIKLDERLKQKIIWNNEAMRFAPVPVIVTQQALLLTLDGQLDAAKRLMEQLIWSFPGDQVSHQRLLQFADRDPAHFAALLEFVNQKEEERARAIHHQ